MSSIAPEQLRIALERERKRTKKALARAENVTVLSAAGAVGAVGAAAAAASMTSLDTAGACTLSARTVAFCQCIS